VSLTPNAFGNVLFRTAFFSPDLEKVSYDTHARSKSLPEESMRRNLIFVCAASVLLIFGCSSATEPEPAATTPAPDTSSVTDAADPVAGTWTGDWGPSANDRNPITVDLRWEGTNLTGTFNPGPEAVPLTMASFNRDTGAITMEADAPGRGGSTYHYVIEGTVAGNMMSGTWRHDNVQGDFKLTRN
jgi:hypothetical protein